MYVWLNGTKVEVLPNSSHVLPPGHHIIHPYHHILTVALEQQAYLFKLHPASVHVCSTFTRPSAQSSLPQGHCRHIKHYACLIMWHRSNTHVWHQAFFFCYSFTRLAGLLAAAALRSLLNSAIEQQAWWLQLYSTSIHLTSIYFRISCKWLASTSVVAGAESAGISVTLVSDIQLCPYDHTPPQCF